MGGRIKAQRNILPFLIRKLRCKQRVNQGLPQNTIQPRRQTLWYDDEYLYMISSTLDRDTVFRIAGSVKQAVQIGLAQRKQLSTQDVR